MVIAFIFALAGGVEIEIRVVGDDVNIAEVVDGDAIIDVDTGRETEAGGTLFRFPSVAVVVTASAAKS